MILRRSMHGFCGVGKISVWRCIWSKIRRRQALDDSSIFKFYKQRLEQVKLWQTNLSRIIRKCRKSDAVCMDFLLFPLSLYISPWPPVIFLSGMFGYKYKPPSS